MGIIGTIIIIIGVVLIISNSLMVSKSNYDYLPNFITGVSIILLGYMFILTDGILTAIKTIGG